MTYTLYHGDCLDILPTLAADSVDTIITDPPYGLGFMGKDWDHGVPGVRFWTEALRVAKPGAFLLAFGGTRTVHRLACAIEDAGWEIRDRIMYVYGTGFPKNHDISKAIDKAAGAEREVVRSRITPNTTAGKGISNELDERPWLTQARHNGYHEHVGPVPATPAAEQWDGWGTALKPAHEPVLVCTKPLLPEQLFGIIVESVTNLFEEFLLCQPSIANDVEKSFTDIQARLKRARVHTVHENARTNVWENIESARYVASIFTFSGQGSCDPKRTQPDSVLLSVRGNGNQATTSEKTTPPGAADDILMRVQDIYMSVITGDISENIASSWSSISDELLTQANTFTTRTAIRLITELKTLRLSLSQTISGDTGNLSPNFEPIIVAMKPLDGTFANNALEHGVAGLWIDGGRVGTEGGTTKGNPPKLASNGVYGNGINGACDIVNIGAGRWPANLIHDGSDEVLAGFPDNRPGGRYPGRSQKGNKFTGTTYNNGSVYSGIVDEPPRTTSTGSAARFFYCDKASRRERNAGLPDGETCVHPTVKPIALARYLARLTKTPTGGVMLDMFAGSGSLGCGGLLEGRDVIVIEQEAEYIPIMEARLRHWQTVARQAAGEVELEPPGAQESGQLALWDLQR